MLTLIFILLVMISLGLFGSMVSHVLIYAAGGAVAVLLLVIGLIVHRTQSR